MIKKSSNIHFISFILFHLIVFITAINLFSQENKEINIRIIAEDAVLRLKPSKESLAIKRLSLGSELEVIEKVGEWIKIKMPPDEDGIVVVGYVHQSFVEEVAKKVVGTIEIEEEKPKVISKLPPKVHVPEKAESLPKSYLGGGIGYAVPLEKNYEGAIEYGGNMSLGITENIAIEIGGLSFRSNIKGSSEGLSTGKLSIVPVALYIQIRFPIKNRFVPYIKGGGSYYFVKYNLDNDIINSWNTLGFNIEEKVENAMGINVGAGIDFFIRKNIALNIDMKYYNVNLKGTWKLLDQVTNTEVSGHIENINLNSFMLGVGLKLYFWRRKEK